MSNVSIPELSTLLLALTGFLNVILAIWKEVEKRLRK
jgi:NADH:ubiquinone oxidoreductase subunit 4 (subunit M)